MRAARSACYGTRSPLTPPVRSFSVPDFLAPALLRPAPRPSPTHRRRLHTEAPDSPPQLPLHPPASYPPSSKQLPKWRISHPQGAERDDIRAWVAVLDLFLPSHLRRDASPEPDGSQPAAALELANTLNEAGKCGHELLTHMCLVEGRWDAVSWLVKRLVEDGAPGFGMPLQLEPHANVVWPEAPSLKALTEAPIVPHRVRPSRKLAHTLEYLTSAPDTIDVKKRTVKAALGQIWLGLGTMILKAAEESSPEESPILSHALEIVAYLHHTGIIPDSIYSSQTVQHPYALQQPPTLHLLSSSILTALSDAQWRAHEAAATSAAERRNASYFLGREIPGSRFQVRVQGIAPELWLELVLWSCLHGGWVAEGAAILERLTAQQDQHVWHVISWNQLMQSDQQEEDTSRWGIFGRRKDAAAKAEARTHTRRTISSEVVTAFVDGLVNIMRLGVGTRGAEPEDILNRIKQLKQLLDRNAHSLGSATWDSVMVRLVESGGVIPEKRPELLLSITGLAAGFGSEVASVNACSQASKTSTEPPYFYEPTATSVSLLHRTIWSFVENGDMSGAIAALNTLQHYTDDNKQKSLRQFFEKLKSIRPNRDELFTDSVHSIDYPAFNPQLPIPLLAKLLDLATEAEMFDLGRWLLLREELDGPLITRDMYSHPDMAPAIIRFGTLAGENELVMKVARDTGFYVRNQQASRLPNKVLTALMASQVQLHRWETVESMQQYVVENPACQPGPSVLATFAAEILRLHAENAEIGEVKEREDKKRKACDAFANLLFAWEKIIFTRLRDEFFSILAITSSVQADCERFCSQFLTAAPNFRIKLFKLSTSDFNQLLAGVLSGYGGLEAAKLVAKWCKAPPRGFEAYRSPGGLPQMSVYRPTKAEQIRNQPPNIEITQPSGATLSFKGRVTPNRQTVLPILRKMQEEVELETANGKAMSAERRAEVRSTLQWIVQLVYNLGFDYDDLVRDFGSIAKFAELQRPEPSKISGRPAANVEADESRKE